MNDMSYEISPIPGPTDRVEIGMYYGLWIPIRPAEKHTYFCRCKCGNTRNVLGYNLMTGRSKSCGCVARIRAAERERERIRLATG